MSKIFKLGVIGNPIEHSLSPFIHSRFARKEGLNIDYKAYRVEQGDFNGFISEFFSDKYAKGLNVTLPLKNLAATNIKGNLSNEAKFINAVNTIIKKDKQFFLESTDGSGFIDDLHKKSINPEGKKILILGAGSAVESILYKLYNSRPEHITIVNRTKEKAENLKKLFKNIEIIEWGEIPNFDISINATSIGLKKDDHINLDFTLISKNSFFYDVIYNPRETNFLKTGKSLGGTTLNGKLMFIYQALSAFNIWHGIEPSVNEDVIKLLD